MINEKAHVDVSLNGEQAKQELEQLKKRFKDLVELKKKAEAAGDVEAWKKIDTEMKKNERTQRSVSKNYADIENTLKNINNASFNELIQAKTVLLKKLNDLKRGTKV